MNSPSDLHNSYPTFRLARRLIQGLVLAVVFVMALTKINPENDLWWQLQMGKDIIEKHAFYLKDIYSHAAYGLTWTLHEWVPSVIFYAIYRWLGFNGLIFLKASLVALVFWVVLAIFNRQKINLYLSLVFLVIAALVNTRGQWAVMPTLFEYLFLVLAYWLIEVYRQGNFKIIWLLPVLALVWTQSHGSFFLLHFLIFALLLGDILTPWLGKKLAFWRPEGPVLGPQKRKALWLVLGFSFLIVLLTPNSYVTYFYPFVISFGKFSKFVNEYMSFSQVWRTSSGDLIMRSSVWLFVAGLLILFFNYKRASLFDLLLFGGFSFLMFRAIRHIAIFALVDLLLITKYLSYSFQEYAGVLRRTPLKDALAVVGFLLFLSYYKTNLVDLSLGVSYETFPKKAAEFITVHQAELSPELYNHYNVGGFLIWHLPKPRFKVFVDGRLEMYENQIGDDFVEVAGAGQNWQQILDKYHINLAITGLDDLVAPLLFASEDWKIIYFDNEYAIFAKNIPDNQKMITQYNGEAQQRIKSMNLLSENKEAFLANVRGVKLVLAKKFKEGAVEFQKAVGLDPNFTLAHLNLGQAKQILGDQWAAFDEYQIVWQLAPAVAEEQGLPRFRIQDQPAL